MRLPSRGFWKRLAVVYGVLLALLCALELAARAAEPGPFTLFDTNPYLEDDVLRHRHKADFVGHWEGTHFETNSLGMRGAEVPLEKPPGEFRVVALGDSCTFGKSVVESDTWPRQLERLLASEMSPGRTARVANLGVNGFAGHEYHEMYFRLGAKLSPDLVLVGYNLNDFPNVIFDVDYRVYKNRRLRVLFSQTVRDWLGRTASYRWLRATYYELAKERDWAAAERFARETARNGQDSAVWKEQVRILSEIVTACRENGTEVAVFLFPYESQIYLDAYDATPIELARGLCERLDVPFVDLAERFRAYAHRTDPPTGLFVRGDRYHPTGEGYAIVAEAVMEVLRERGWIPAR
ncbi:MAG: GDSL-type esterase/lipase family protein [Planctomycetota bacterium]